MSLVKACTPCTCTVTFNTGHLTPQHPLSPMTIKGMAGTNKTWWHVAYLEDMKLTLPSIHVSLEPNCQCHHWPPRELLPGKVLFYPFSNGRKRRRSLILSFRERLPGDTIGPSMVTQRRNHSSPGSRNAIFS